MSTIIQPSINANDHGPQVIMVGGIMLAATVLVMAIVLYNRYNAKTMLHIDSPLLLVGLVRHCESPCDCRVCLTIGCRY